ncbi:unnamed protein product [Protopolystoma xenopodis]|uniref:Replication factor C C-terminal domain-containing protein n=1 Tax=Protopolystoma xenopodis TaxID=117903 RepID=A0A3S5ACI5_9PLAT|nr:unnamed protein product [Protopolystoma xenopodis]
MSFSEINENNVYACVAYPSPKEIRSILQEMLTNDISGAYKTVEKLKYLKGIALQDIVTELHPLVLQMSIPDKIRCELLISLSDIEYRLSLGASENLQLGSLVSTFGIAKENLLENVA